MINSENEVIIDLRASVSEDEAIKRLLGWDVGPLQRRVIHVDENGFVAGESPPLSESLVDALDELRERARIKLIAAADGDPDPELLAERDAAVRECDDLIVKAALYVREFREEVSKGEGSEIHLDPQATKDSGIPCYTLTSIDRWAKRQLRVSVLDTNCSPGESDQASGQSSPPEREKPRPRGGLSAAKADGVYTTFGFLVEAFSKTAPKYRNKDKPNVSAIANELFNQACEANKGDKVDKTGVESIKGHIEEALRTMKEHLPEK